MGVIKAPFVHFSIKTLRPRQNGRHFADDIFTCVFLNENIWMQINISLKFLIKCQINNIPQLLQIMTCRRPGARPLFYWRIYASLGTNELWKFSMWYKRLLDSLNTFISDMCPRSLAEAIIYEIRIYSISQEICTRFCCLLLCCGYAIVHNEFTWNIYPYSSGLLCWHWGNR